MLRIEFLTGASGVLDDVYTETDAETLEVNAVLPTAASEWLLFLTATGHRTDPATAIVSLDGVELLHEQTPDSTIEATSIVAIIDESDGLLPQTLATLHAIPHSMLLNGQGVESVVTVEDWNHLQTTANELEARHGVFELLSVTEVDQFGSILGTDHVKQTVRSAMTPDQLEALETAYQMGYFVVPRDVTANDVATRLGVSQSTFSERLRRGMENLLAIALGRQP